MNFSGRLRSFAQDLAPSQSEVTRAGETIDVISRAIQAHFRGRGLVDRITPFGSYPKKTSISGSMDVDIIVYFNNLHPPFSDIIQELYRIVIIDFDSSCRRDSFGVYFSYKDLKVDLLPAKNFLPTSSSHNPYVDRSINAQHARALQYVKTASASERKYYSTSMSGISVLFEQKRDSFSHSVSRLAKYWSSKLNVDRMRGQSSIMEYLGAYAAERESYSQNTYWAFRRFLKLLESPDSINIYWTEFYNHYDIPDYTLTQRPLLLDPCNPYNNFLNINDNASIVRRMTPYAKATLARLEAAFDRDDAWKIENIFSEAGRISDNSWRNDNWRWESSRPLPPVPHTQPFSSNAWGKNAVLCCVLVVVCLFLSALLIIA